MIGSSSCDATAKLGAGDVASLSQCQPVLTLCRRCLASPSDVGSDGITTCIAQDGQASSVYYLKNPWLLCVERRPTLPERKLVMPPKISIHSSVVHYIENNNAPIYIDARTVDVDARVRATAGDEIRGGSDFQFSPSYDRIVLRGSTYRFGPLQAAIIRMLHAASGSPCPWLPLDQVLADVGAKSRHFRDAFKNHDRDALFEFDDLNRVRLRL